MPLLPTDPKIVTKPLFSILYFLKKNKSPHFFAPPLRKLRGGAKKWGLLFFVILFIMKIWLITDLYIFATEYTLAVAHLGLESTVS